MEGTIYKIENKVNGKVYIGQTRQKFERRINVHFWSLEKNEHDNAYLQNAYNKYGANSFTSSILEKCDKEDLNDAEVFWIAYFKAFNGVYNLESGGSNNKEIHEITRKKMSIITKSHGWIGGKHPFAKRIIRINDKKIFDSMVEASSEIGTTASNIYQNCKGNNGACLGDDGVWYQFDYYEEGREYNYSKYDDSKTKTPKKVICVNTREMFNSTCEASKKTGVSQSKISLCCNKKREFAGRFQNGDWMKWVFEDDYDSSKEYGFKRFRKQNKETREKIRKANTGKFKHNKYLCRESNGNTIIFDSRDGVLDFIKSELGIEASIYTINKCCNGKLKTAYGLFWEYAD